MVLTDFSTGTGLRLMPGDLSPAQRWGLSLAVLALHIGVGTAVWRTATAPITPAEQPPLMVSLISDQAPAAAPAPVSPPQPKPPVAQPPVAQPPIKREAPPVLASARP
ncbi:MAG: hypothetical protein EOP38_21230, partial [Rubrivivax sp.]